MLHQLCSKVASMTDKPGGLVFHLLPNGKLDTQDAFCDCEEKGIEKPRRLRSSSTPGVGLSTHNRSLREGRDTKAAIHLPR